MANAVTAFLDDRIAAGQGDRPAIVTPVGSTTYRELLTVSARIGHGLRRLGVEPEQRVGLLLPDGLEWAATFFGALRIGAVAVPLNTRLAPHDWAAMLRDCRAKVLVGDPALLETLRPALSDQLPLQTVEARGLGRHEPTTLDPEGVGTDEMAFWLYTSGTTGQPKAAVHLHRDLLACLHYGLGVLEASERDRVFGTSKLFFAYALGNSLVIPLFVGAQTYLHPGWADPATVLEVMSRFQPTLFFSVPTFYARLLRADLPRDAFSSVRCAVSAGERLPDEIYWAARERFGLEILDGVGATETIFMVLSSRPGRSRAGSCGTPVPGTEGRLLDAEGREVPAGAEGVLHVKTPSASPFYWNRPEQSRGAFIGEWFRTGDVYTRDADGFYYHRGREDDRIKVAGMWVAPTDVEAVLLAHPDVADAGVVGGEDEQGLMKPFAFVVPRRPEAGAALTEALRHLVETKLATHQRPKTIVVVPELPRTATGKLQRFLLRPRRPR